MSIAQATDLVEGRAPSAAGLPGADGPWHRQPPPPSGAGAFAKAPGGQGGPGGAWPAHAGDKPPAPQHVQVHRKGRTGS